MEALKNVMNTLDVIKEKLTDKEYKEMSDDMKKAYDSFKVGKYIKVLQVESQQTVYWKDTDGDSGITTGQDHWCHNSWKEGEDNCSEQGHLDSVEMKTELKVKTHILKIIDDDTTSCMGLIINENTIENSNYLRLKETKFCHSGMNGLIIFIDDCVED